MSFRTEQDMLGQYDIEEDRYYGINTKRALENFKLEYHNTNIKLIKELALIKKAAATVNGKLMYLDEDKAKAIAQASEEVIAGKFNEELCTNALQGGAGTSANMNVNEVIANRAIELLGGKKGDYSLVHPLNDVNMCQSTNDVYPTALRIAAIKLIRQLSEELAKLQQRFQEKEQQFNHIIKLGRTELMDAVPMLAGQGFGAYAKALERDRWRIYKVEERLRQINIGGTAIGTGLNAPLKYIYMITEELQDLTGLGLARSDYPMDITQNADVFVEVSGLLKACSTNLIKISADLRLLASGPAGGIGEIKLPQMQAGSTIMPGKVNPVITEMITQVAIKVIANDQAITMAASMGQLELNAFMPLIADSLLQSLQLLKDGVTIFGEKCVEHIDVDKEECERNLIGSTALAAAIVQHIGYDKASYVAKKAIEDGVSIKEVLINERLFTPEEAEQLLNPFEVTKPGIPGRS
ncbi:aspartate ammonia-lyase [Clostridium oryzae]|uniref:Fumarate hydratase class II n=1 Tax=Clostridium oryzae TaxID=1450648 RepID=A0A1V4IMQ1_9CLOT|nr:aspartate ammonia-lyase [Clostridium oryzae]OPJ61318.1 fumarate hydratase class II [Clostridium oryzae]